MEKYPLPVVAALIERDNKYLITKRPNDGRQNSGEWEFPGGRVEFGEHTNSTLERISQELGIKLKAGDLFGVSSHVYREDLHVLLLGIHCIYVSGEIQNHDIADSAWAFPREMNNYNISKPDLVFVERLKQISG